MKLLFIARHFPPDGGGGVQRSAKFVKFLPQHGIEPVVLTGLDARTSRYVPEDASLAAEIGRDTVVHRVSYPHEKPTLQDKVDALTRAGREILRHERFDAILVTASPYEDVEIARRLAAATGLPWIADLRDPWALDEFLIHPSRWHRGAARRRMAASLATASLVIMNTPVAARRCREAFPGLASSRIVSLTNGYDEDDFTRRRVAFPTNDRFTIVHTGALHTRRGLRQQRSRNLYRLLGRVEPGVSFLPRSHFFLNRAIAAMLHRHPERRSRLKLVLAGTVTPDDREATRACGLDDVTDFRGYVEHHESVSLLCRADLLFLPLHDVAASRPVGIVPGKTYEYLASGRPILAALPPGDARDFVAAASNSTVVPPTDVAAMETCLDQAFARWLAHGGTATVPAAAFSRFERRELTARLAAELHAITGTRAPQRPVLVPA